jgi:hypothetical protein
MRAAGVASPVALLHTDNLYAVVIVAVVAVVVLALILGLRRIERA